MSKIIDHSTYAPECTCCDDWHTCATCGADKGNLDLWQAYCPRCAELAELEREIGRAVIACRDTESVMQGYESRISLNDAEVVDYRAAEKRIIQQETALDALIARYRELHAAGAEEGR